MKKSRHTTLQLRRKFRDIGVYFRQPNIKRRKKEGAQYKKGYEVRIPIRSLKELREIKNDLKDIGFSPGKPFKKASQYILPIYGYEQLTRFIKLFKIRTNKPILKPKI